MPQRLRHAICNEIFENWTFAKTCRAIRQAGYSGIEIAPFTLAEYPSTLSPARRRECRDIINAEGLQFAGLHWLMVRPKGLHVTTPDADLRSRSWEHIRHLIDLCADLGPDGVLVFGSPQQRATIGGLSRAEATRHFVEGLAAAAPHAGQRGVTILIEALPLGQCDVVTSLDEAAALVREIDHPAIRTMFDCHNAIDETEPHAALVDRHYDLIRHIHVNELDGRHPGTGSYDFKALFNVLRRREYGGWISLEAFDFTPGAKTVARESLAFLEKQ
jgi:sugar phosphate isomerase/epimerase